MNKKTFSVAIITIITLLTGCLNTEQDKDTVYKATIPSVQMYISDITDTKEANFPVETNQGQSLLDSTDGVYKCEGGRCKPTTNYNDGLGRSSPTNEVQLYVVSKDKLHFNLEQDWTLGTIKGYSIKVPSVNDYNIKERKKYIYYVSVIYHTDAIKERFGLIVRMEKYYNTERFRDYYINIEKGIKDTGYS